MKHVLLVLGLIVLLITILSLAPLKTEAKASKPFYVENGMHKRKSWGHARNVRDFSNHRRVSKSRLHGHRFLGIF